MSENKHLYWDAQQAQDMERFEKQKRAEINAWIAKHGREPRPGEASLIMEPQSDGSCNIRIEENVQNRKGEPVYSGVMQYFPRAIRAISRVSLAGNDKHNPGQPLHWAHDKSCDQPDAAARHMLTAYDIDPDTGEMHLAHAAWRVLAWLEMTLWAIEEDHANLIGDFQKIGQEMADEYK